MRLNPRIAFLCAACIIISGLIGSFKSYQIYKEQMLSSEVSQGQSMAELAGQSVEQKLMQMESAVSYLDQSTIETLKRMGARYFAYAYQKDSEWSIKWKVLGALGKEAILSEVRAIDFSKLSAKTRHWTHGSGKELIYITPVALANSHQLKDGYLVFGLDKDFFMNHKDYNLISVDGEIIFGENIVSDTNLSDWAGVAFNSSEAQSSMDVVTGAFLERAQIWVVHQKSLASVSFIQSRFFTFFLLATGLGIFLLTIVTIGRGGREVGQLSKMLDFIPAIKIPQISLKLNRFKKETAVATEDIASSDILEEVLDFADFLDHVLADEMERLNKVGVSVRTQVEEGAGVVCSPQRVTDFIKRLIGNSVLSLEDETEKEIQIQLVEQANSFQLIYVDTRSKHFPSGQAASLMAQTEGSLQGIDGIIAYAGWLFGENLTVAKKGFCLSIDLQKIGAEVEAQSIINVEEPIEEVDFKPLEAIPFESTLDIIEDHSGHSNHSEQNCHLEQSERSEDSSAELQNDIEEPSISFDDVIDQFRMKEFTFSAATEEKNADVEEKNTESTMAEEIEELIEQIEPEKEPEVELTSDDKGLFEFNSGQFKIKIRSPKKRDNDANS